MSDDEEFSFKPAKRTALQKENAEKLKAKEQKTQESRGQPDPVRSASASDPLLGPLQQHANSFSDQLERVDKEYAALAAEKKAGWNSPAVEAEWKRRTESLANVNRATHQGGAPSTGKYVDFYRKMMPVLDRELFGTPRAGTRFADFGSAPGGMSEYLVRDLEWQGDAFSLAVADGGFAMQFRDAKVAYHDCDMAQEGAWKVPAELLAEGSCRFVNGGIVVDRGQTKGSEADAQNIYVNELISALNALACGGALYFAYQQSEVTPGYATLFRLLLLVRPYFSGCLRVTHTSQPGRTPLYCYLGGFVGLEKCGPCMQALRAGELPLYDGTTWSAEVSTLYTELRDDFHYVWRLQREELRKKRESAERKMGYKGSRSGF